MRRLVTSPFLIGFFGALAAAAIGLLVLLVIHLWSDHVALHVLINYLNQHAAAINKLPQ